MLLKVQQKVGPSLKFMLTKLALSNFLMCCSYFAQWTIYLYYNLWFHLSIKGFVFIFFIFFNFAFVFICLMVPLLPLICLAFQCLSKGDWTVIKTYRNRLSNLRACVKHKLTFIFKTKQSDFISKNLKYLEKLLNRTHLTNLLKISLGNWINLSWNFDLYCDRIRS